MAGGARRSAEAEAKRSGMLIMPLGVRTPDDFDAAYSEMTKTPPDAILMVTDVLTVLNRKRMIDFAAEHRLPAIYEYANLVPDGRLISYGPDVDAIFDRAVGLADRILKGTPGARRRRHRMNMPDARATSRPRRHGRALQSGGTLLAGGSG
jgi:putative tryptophan/tyrosine transport system substrate-binding protein